MGGLIGLSREHFPRIQGMERFSGQSLQMGRGGPGEEPGATLGIYFLDLKSTG